MIGSSIARRYPGDLFKRSVLKVRQELARWAAERECYIPFDWPIWAQAHRPPSKFLPRDLLDNIAMIFPRVHSLINELRLKQGNTEPPDAPVSMLIVCTVAPAGESQPPFFCIPLLGSGFAIALMVDPSLMLEVPLTMY